MRVLIYSFRTNPFRAELAEIFGNCFVFASLKRDLEVFETVLRTEQPEFIVGIARATGRRSQIETKAINRFHQHGRVLAHGPDEYRLHLPKSIASPSLTGGFRLNPGGTDSFCNWTAYRVSHILAQVPPGPKHLFFHCHATDLARIPELLRTLR